MSKIAYSVALADEGVVWKSGSGALCPVCGKRMRVVSTQGVIRFCRCKTSGCIIKDIQRSVKAAPE